MKQQLIRLLLEHRIIKFNFKKPFTFKTGLRSPIYVDLRECMKHYKIMELIKNLFKIKIEKLSIDGILGVATGGIAHAMFLNTQFRLPFGYVRLDAKAYGLGKNIEGIDVLWKNVVVIEDTVSTGGSLLDSIKILKDSGASFVYPLCIYSHDMQKAKEGFSEAGYNLDPLITFNEVVQLALNENIISVKEHISLCRWYEDPENWFERYKDSFGSEEIE